MAKNAVYICSACIATWLVACDAPKSSDLAPFEFSARALVPHLLSDAELQDVARKSLLPDEVIASVTEVPVDVLGEDVLQVVTSEPNNARAFVVQADGTIESTQRFWADVHQANLERFGRMTPGLFSLQTSSSGPFDVTITVVTDLAELRLPYDGTDQQVPMDEFKAWFNNHAAVQQARVWAAKNRVRALLVDHGAEILEDPRGLPSIRATVARELLQSQDLNASDVIRIEATATDRPVLLGDYAGRSSMNAAPASGGLSGGQCGGPCDGGLIDVGLWERDDSVVGYASGLARNNSRITASAAGYVTGYWDPPRSCVSDADCSYPGISDDVERRCQAELHGVCNKITHCTAPDVCTSGRCVTPDKHCVQDHLTWSAAAVGMWGPYDYTAQAPFGLPDPTPNVPTGTSFASTGAWRVDYRVGNESGTFGLDYLIAPAAGTGPATPFLNRSQSGAPDAIDFASRAYGTFVTYASGNSDVDPVSCNRFKNGLCVGMYDYRTYDDQQSHRRTHGLPGNKGSSYLNNGTLERPHLLGPGFHAATGTSLSGLHMPDIEPAAPTGGMRYAFQGSGSQYSEIGGTSFAAPTVLSAAIQAQEYEGWFSNLAFSVVNKAVLLASTVDANADGAIGKSTTWSSQPSDAEDGAGQINFGLVQQVLDSNQYYWIDLVDSNLSSCGTGCRKYAVSNVTVPANAKMRIALAWQACSTDEASEAIINNDLDLALNCGNPILSCGGTTLSTSASSEIEMLERPGCPQAKACTIEVRIKNGVALAPCGTTTFERIGVAWSYLYP